MLFSLHLISQSIFWFNFCSDSTNLLVSSHFNPPQVYPESFLFSQFWCSWSSTPPLHKWLYCPIRKSLGIFSLSRFWYSYNINLSLQISCFKSSNPVSRNLLFIAHHQLAITQHGTPKYSWKALLMQSIRYKYNNKSQYNELSNNNNYNYNNRSLSFFGVLISVKIEKPTFACRKSLQMCSRKNSSTH